jgi:hypothetical protein
MATRETRAKTKTIAINFFFIENPSFRLDLLDLTYIDGSSMDLFNGKREVENGR